MPEEILILSILGLLISGGVVIFIAKNIFDIIKARSGAGKNSGQINPQFFKALGEFKKTTERRITNLEAIVTDLEEEKIRVPKATGSIEIESEDLRESKQEDKGNNLRNMLNE